MTSSPTGLSVRGHGLAALAVLLLAGPARADWALDAGALARVVAGGAHADVRPDPRGATGLVHGAIDIAAPPDVVWGAITDCANAARVAPGGRGCRLVERDPAGRWDVRELTVGWSPLAPPFRTRFRSEFEARRVIRFHCVGGDVAVCFGEWRLEALPGGRTRVLYENRATSPIPAPASMARMAMRHNLLRSLESLRHEAEARTR
ncbi:MAG: SRPBCC family protein [Caulobacter sp.]|nr:SRPBCC family protein [Caulobacter sp.]